MVIQHANTTCFAFKATPHPMAKLENCAYDGADSLDDPRVKRRRGAGKKIGSAGSKDVKDIMASFKRKLTGDAEEPKPLSPAEQAKAEELERLQEQLAQLEEEAVMEGDLVEVVTAFTTSNSDDKVRLDPGCKGRVTKIKDNGSALIKIDTMAVAQVVKAKHLKNLKVLPPEPAPPSPPREEDEEPRGEQGTFSEIWQEGDETVGADWHKTGGLKFHTTADKAYALDAQRARALASHDPLAGGNSEQAAEQAKRNGALLMHRHFTGRR